MAAASWRVRHVRNAAAAGAAVPFAPTMPVQPAGTATAKATISAWQGYSPSPLVRAPEQLAAKCGVAELWLKDETNRFGLGSFKVLGGGLAVVNELAKGATATATASAGNHGIGVAWASANPSFGGPVPCHVYLSASVPEASARKIASYKATVHRVDGPYEAALAQAKKDAAEQGWAVVQDVSWEGYDTVPRRIFEGYTVLADEMMQQLAGAGTTATHVLVNCGVGGLATAVCSHLWAAAGPDRPRFIAVEPLVADCLRHAAQSGGPVPVPADPDGATTVQVGLDCKIADGMAWQALSTGVNDFVAIGDEAVQPAVLELAAMAPTPIQAGESAVAGLGVLLAAAKQPALRASLGLTPTSRIAVIICEGTVHA